jgi:RNA polymerase sigma factor (sigma-70 family)
MKSGDLKSMSVDKLWELHEAVCAELGRKMETQKATLEERLRKLNSPTRWELKRTSRRYPKVLPPLSSDQVGFREQSAIAEKALMALTDRERQIMRLVSEGLSNKEIGRRLNLTDGTIKVHLHNIFQKLEIGNRTALAALAIAK